MNSYTITGYTADGLPVIQNSPEYQRTLESLRSSRPGTQTAEELDERWTEAARRNNR